ncbi:hypothetical protein RHS01_07834 [Rhizoctonia solani]|uniref:non-specific serine/threonine protein kinase n=1 Tax=Rhizoctonia solani TaxID=456999 RepID=A0A8H7I799_9AGAM|nr:hypothetical protein RHS01_07834 [Rhizoctonia solani]
MTPAVSRPPDDNEAHPYVITNEIGKGSFATVYRGYHGESRRAVAIKTISRSILTTKLLDNLESEINILKSLKNKHITELTDIVKAQRNIYLIMEFCSGGDLSSYIKHRGRIAALHTPTSPAPAFLPHPKVGGLSDSVVRSFIGQLSSAMKFLRARDLIHRDVKPQNLLLSPADSVDEYACVGKGGWIPGPVGTPILKVADFGFARILPNASMAETLCGSPLYMAPEILRYEKYDAKADLWSVGAVVYEAAVGRPPFRAQNHIELLKKIDHARSRVHFPDEDPKNADAIARGDLVPVSPAVKLLIRSLLKRKSVERKSFEDFFVMAEEVVKPVMEPERDVGSELADAMKDATIDGGMGAPGAGTGTGSTNGSLKIELRASRRAPQPPPKSAVEKPTEPVERPTSPTSDGGEKPKRRKPRGEIEAGPGGGPEIDVKAVMPQSTFKFRRAVRPEDAKVVERIDGPPLGREETLIEFPGPRPKPLSAVNGKLKKTGSNQSLRSPVAAPVPEGEEEGDNDGDMRKEYVLVDETNAVEFNRVVDELDHARLARPTIRTTKSTPPTSATIAPIDVPASASLPVQAVSTNLRPHPHPLAHWPVHSTSQAELFGTSASSTPLWFERRTSGGFSRRSTTPDPSPPTTEPDPEEEHLLGTLEDLAQKAETIAAWADSKYTLVDARPSKPIADPARFARAVGETAKGAETRRKHEVEVEMAAVTAIGLYMAVMSFATGAIVIARRFLDGREGAEVSAGFDEAQKWFRDAFHRSTERVSILKHWLPRDHVMPQMWIDRVIYDHALTLMRGAASRELLEDYSTCERDYEDALWLLYAIYDDIMQEGNPYKDQDRVTIGRFIKSTKDRLVRVQKRIERQKAQQQQVAAQS